MNSIQCFLLLICLVTTAGSATYYLDMNAETNGSGTSKSSPFNDPEAVNRARYTAGLDSILIERQSVVKRLSSPKSGKKNSAAIGGSWSEIDEKTKNYSIRGVLWIRDIDSLYIGVYDARGSSGKQERPVIDAEGAEKSAAILLERCNDVVVEGLDIRNTIDLDNGTIEDSLDAVGMRSGIAAIYWHKGLTEPKIYGGITIRDNVIRDVYGSYVRMSANGERIKEETAKFKGIDIKENAPNKPAFYGTAGILISSWSGSAVINSISIENNTIQDIVGAAIRVKAGSSYEGTSAVPPVSQLLRQYYRGFQYGKNMYLSKGLYVGSNRIETTAADGIVVGGSQNPIVEYNTVRDAGVLGFAADSMSDSHFNRFMNRFYSQKNGSNDFLRFRSNATLSQLFETAVIAGIWTRGCENGLIQYNTVIGTVRHDWDGQAFDCDGEMIGTAIFQYNYTENNEGGFFMDWAEEGSPSPLKKYDTSGKTVGYVSPGTIVRYNISVNDAVNTVVSDERNIEGAHHLGLLTLQREHTQIYNNLFYTTGNVRIRKENRDYSFDSASVYNNIFIGDGNASWDVDQAYNHKSYSTPPNNVFYFNNVTVGIDPIPSEFNPYPDSAPNRQFSDVRDLKFQGTLEELNSENTKAVQLRYDSPLIGAGSTLVLPEALGAVPEAVADFWNRSLWREKRSIGPN